MKKTSEKVSAKATKQENLKKENKVAIIKKITEKKDLDYNYPKGHDDLASRKKFRRGVRRKVAQYVKSIGSSELKGKELDALKSKVGKFIEVTFTEKGVSKVKSLAKAIK